MATLVPTRARQIVPTVTDPANGIDGSDATHALVKRASPGPVQAFYVFDQYPDDGLTGVRLSAKQKVRGEWDSTDPDDRVRFSVRKTSTDPWKIVKSWKPPTGWPIGQISERMVDIYPIVGTSDSTQWQFGIEFGNGPGLPSDPPDISDGGD